MEKKVDIFGVPVFNGTMEEALEWIEEKSRSEKKHFAAFVNADCLNQAYVNSAYRALLQRAGVVWADGIGVAIAAKHAGRPVEANVNGTDMFPRLCQSGQSIFLLGGAPHVAEKARENTLKLFPDARIVGVHDGFFAGREEEVIAQINAAAPDILLVAFGVPRQEFWIEQNLPRLNCKVAIGVGGLFDFVSGRIPRAPLWMRKCHMEWSFRLYQEPVRLFRRYVIGNPVFLWRVWFGRQRPAAH